MRLQRIPRGDLLHLSRGEAPPRIAARAVDAALPPAFVAARALAHLDAGKPPAWCATFYIVDAAARIVGGCGFKDVPAGGEVEIGYAVAPACRGAGIATAAVRALLRRAARGGVRRVIAQVAIDNDASTRLVRRLGFAPIGRYEAGGETLERWLQRIGQAPAC